MKKIYLSAFALTYSLFTMAQMSGPLLEISENNSTKPMKPSKAEKALGVIVWEDDFSTAADWTIGAANIQGQWQIVSTTPAQVTQYMGANTTSTAANGFGVFNGVQFLLAPPVDAQNATLTFNTAQDFTAYPSLRISFEQRYRAFNTDETWIEFSTDGGTTWSGVQVNTAEVTNDPAVQNTIELDATPFIGGEASVMVRFRWASPSGDDSFGSGYGWCVDDVKIFTPADNDVSVEEVFVGDLVNDYNYSMIPLGQAAPMIIGIALENAGLNDFVAQPVNISIKLNGGEVHNENVTVSLISAASDTIWQTTSYTPNAIGNYVVDISIPADDDLTNNTGTNALELTNWVFGHDYGGTVARGFPNDSVATSIGNVYRMVNTQDVSAINVKFATGTTVSNGGQEVRVAIYEMTSESIQDDLNFITEQYYTVTGADLSSPFSLIELPAPVTLTAGTSYIAFVEKFAGPLAKKLNVTGSTAGDDDFSTACYGPFGAADAENWFNGWGWSPYVRLNFDPSLAVENISMLDNVNVYPNPSTGNVTISNDNGTENTITVFDISGKQITSKTSNTATTLDLSSFGAGVYVVEITNDNNKKTERVVIR